jgi:hypothetical protein
MNIHSDIPLNLSEINATWLTNVLRSEGVLQQEQVTSFTQNMIGAGFGFLGDVALLDLELSPVDTEAPKSMILKIPTASRNRAAGQILGAYEKEIRFYCDLACRAGLRTPEYFYGAMDADSDSAKYLNLLRLLDRLPALLMGMAFLLSIGLAALTTRRYVLLIEDLRKYRMGDQIKGCDVTDAKLVLSSMAKLHASFWNSEELEQIQWLLPVDVSARTIHILYVRALKKFKAANPDGLSERHLQLLDWLKRHGIQLMAMVAEMPGALLHGDFRLDNICFDDEQGEIILFDWQTLMHGPGGVDLAYFIGTSLHTEAKEDDINELLECYRQELAVQGVAITTRRLQWQYEACLLMVIRTIIATHNQGGVVLGEGRGENLGKVILERLLTRLTNIDADRLLEEIPGD